MRLAGGRGGLIQTSLLSEHQFELPVPLAK